MNAYVNSGPAVRDDLDPLAEVASTIVTGKELRVGMILLDPELGTPDAELVQRIRSEVPGDLRWLVFELDSSEYVELNTFENSAFPVMAK